MNFFILHGQENTFPSHINLESKEELRRLIFSVMINFTNSTPIKFGACRVILKEFIEFLQDPQTTIKVQKITPKIYETILQLANYLDNPTEQEQIKISSFINGLCEQFIRNLYNYFLKYEYIENDLKLTMGVVVKFFYQHFFCVYQDLDKEILKHGHFEKILFSCFFNMQIQKKVDQISEFNTKMSKQQYLKLINRVIQKQEQGHGFFVLADKDDTSLESVAITFDRVLLKKTFEKNIYGYFAFDLEMNPFLSFVPNRSSYIKTFENFEKQLKLFVDLRKSKSPEIMQWVNVLNFIGRFQEKFGGFSFRQINEDQWICEEENSENPGIFLSQQLLINSLFIYRVQQHKRVHLFSQIFKTLPKICYYNLQTEQLNFNIFKKAKKSKNDSPNFIIPMNKFIPTMQTFMEEKKEKIQTQIQKPSQGIKSTQ